VIAVFPERQPNQNPLRRVSLLKGGTNMRAKALKVTEAQRKLTLAEGIGIIVALALLGGLTFGVVAV